MNRPSRWQPLATGRIFSATTQRTVDHAVVLLLRLQAHDLAARRCSMVNALPDRTGRRAIDPHRVHLALSNQLPEQPMRRLEDVLVLDSQPASVLMSKKRR